ncbi:hypothetical protein MRS44_017339 [Fusarium solani]|uniref:uncharacterized protein n=1 Tax=Fusarium solani TaxID=169388 RepID=UPI00230B492E|nr:hypothetical protein MRS44_017339 [Fusarium solani]KAJ4205019.1 hypothetical protein NW759_014685 [Fusarium solani]
MAGWHGRLAEAHFSVSTNQAIAFCEEILTTLDLTSIPQNSYQVFVYDLATSQYSTQNLKAGKIRDVAVLFPVYPQSWNPSPRKRSNDEISKDKADAEMGWSTDDEVLSGEEAYPL